MKLAFLVVLFLGVSAQAAVAGLSHDPKGTNQLLGVSVSHGLPGLDIDIKNVVEMSKHTASSFKAELLAEEQGTGVKVQQALERNARAAGANGTFFFYYTGHGSPGSIYLQDGALGIEKIRAAMEKGRAGLGPMKRLVFMLDSCYSGSNIDPLNLGLLPGTKAFNDMWVEETMEKLKPGKWGTDYWEEIFVLMSSRANQTSLAGEDGSVFTVALKKAWDESISQRLTLKDLVAKTKEYTVGHNPVEKFDPADLANEKVAD